MANNKTSINIIVALGKQNQIGLNNTMPWHLSDDLKSFKKITSGHTIIMGRKTFESIGKALPNRMNFVLTSQPKTISAYEVCSFKSLDKAIKKAQMYDDEIFVIGGASVFEETLKIADKLIVTHVDYDGEADTFFPKLDYKKWQKISSTSFDNNEHNQYDFKIATYIKN